MNEISKHQIIRLADVFIIGPLMIHAGSQNKFSKIVNISLMVFGAATILYNGRNYLLNVEKEKWTKIQKES